VGYHPSTGVLCYFNGYGRPWSATPQPNKERAARLLSRIADAANEGREIRPLVPLLRIEGAITDDLASEVSAFVLAHHSDNLNLVVNSRGGSYAAGRRIYNSLRNHRYQVCARVADGCDCMSAAVLAIAACDWVEAGPKASFVLHCVEIPPSQGRNSDTRWTALEHSSAATEAAGYDAEMGRLFAALTGLPEARFQAVMRADRTLSAEEMLALRLVDSVIGVGELAPERRQPAAKAAKPYLPGPGAATPMRLGVPGGRTSF
jgi:ATP-dependent protease ClpP protease subunit